MPISIETNEELKLLVLYKLNSSQEGIKVHSEAAETRIAAAKRLHEKGLITNPDGGYLTNLGIEALEHAQKLLGILKAV